MRARLVVLAAAGVVLSGAASAQAYDTGPHSDITRDAMLAEGFGPTAADIGVVNNWFVDIYSNASKVPHSGHADTINEILAFSYGDREHWPQDVIDAAEASHFDSTFPTFSNAVGLEAEWTRLRRAVGQQALLAKQNNNPRGLLSLIGMSLHEVQDFYSHTNWVDAIGYPGADGPNWPQLQSGNSPTWFDVDPIARDSYNVYAGGTPGHEKRKHEGWNKDKNKTAVHGLNKDWPGRPGYDNAHIASYFATRQWLRALRAWINDDALWSRAQRWNDRAGNQLDHDLWGALWIGSHSGHWQGQGEPCNPTWSTSVCGDRNGPGGNLLELRAANKHYFEDWKKSTFRKQFQQGIVEMVKDPGGEPMPIATSQDLQRSTRFVRVRVMKTRARNLSDIGPDDADLYAKAAIAGQQRYQSGTIGSHDNYNFPLPNAPFEWIKAVPADASYYEPVVALQAEIRTSSARYAGTDDDVYLRINGRQRFKLDKRLYDDFERGDRDMYSLPIDDAIKAGLRIADINTVQIEKSPDGVAGGWKLRGVKLIVNGRQLYARDGIEQWLEKNRRTWVAPDFRPVAPSTQAIPVTFDLWDDDYGPYGGDDHGDIDPFGMRRTLAVLYSPGSVLEHWAVGGNRLGGRLGDGDEASIYYKIDTLDTTPAPLPQPPSQPVIDPPPPPTTTTTTTPTTPPVLKPDLVITAMDWNPTLHYYVTIKNQGNAASGAFQVSANAFGPFAVPSLAPGASATVTYSNGCLNATITAQADPTNAIAESNESNNSRSYVADCIP